MSEKVLLDAREAAEFLSVSLRQFRNLQKLESFPAARTLGPRSTRWVRSELEAYAKALPTASQRDEPAQLAAARADKAAGLAPSAFGALVASARVDTARQPA